ncbi:hypothetical protein PoB_001020000 [Plakobranchus ocellatus]|uniref:Uncharacterized protein n=1 Tax=Plakobranchus ocellatus TaxID=259542 RepID=A0AAV3YMG3_9GAST|nr:hypothetical protein PoB_001020000 [Plakobranchus ocellatus]
MTQVHENFDSTKGDANASQLDSIESSASARKIRLFRLHRYTLFSTALTTMQGYVRFEPTKKDTRCFRWNREQRKRTRISTAPMTDARKLDCPDNDTGT